MTIAAKTATEFALFYCTTSSVDEAKTIGRTLVMEGLVACANLLPGMQSIYRWKGEVELAEEVVLILKGAKAKATQITKRVQELHSYEVPCVIQLDIASGAETYLQWLSEESGALKR